MNNPFTAGPMLTRERVVIVAGLLLLAALSWVYLFRLAGDMATLGAMQPVWKPWGALDALLTFAMWAVMMVGMMVPSAAPMVLVFVAINRRRAARGDAYLPTGAFVLGYLVVWTAFSALATLAQWALHSAALLSPMMTGTSPLLGGALLIAGGAFQWTPLKHACLARCRSPLGFLLGEWRDGPRGALVMGLRHGAFCTGCCWALMALLFVGGVMNLLWVALIAAFVLLEKVLPAGDAVAKAAGLGLVGWGAWMMLAAA